MSTPQERLRALLAEMGADELTGAAALIKDTAKAAKAAQSLGAREAAATSIKAMLNDGLDGDLITRVRAAMTEPGLKRVQINVTADGLEINVPLGSTSGGGTGERVMSYTRKGPETARLRTAFVRFMAHVRDTDSSPFGKELTILPVTSKPGWSAFSGLGKPKTGGTLQVRDAADLNAIDPKADFRTSDALTDSAWRVVQEILLDAGLPKSEADRQDLDRALTDVCDSLDAGNVDEYLAERAAE